MEPSTTIEIGNKLQSSELILKRLLICGLLAPLIYVVSDIISAAVWDSYSFTAQSVSELRAIGAPTRLFLIPVLALYSLLEIAFGFGIRRMAGDNRALRITGVLLIGLGLIDTAAPFFPMHLRENLQLSGGSFTDTMHIVITVVTVFFILLIIGYGAAAHGTRFRFYSYATVLTFFVCGAWAFLDAPLIDANLPTPWLGVRERINIYCFMLWMAVLATVLLRTKKQESYDSREMV